MMRSARRVTEDEDAGLVRARQGIAKLKAIRSAARRSLMAVAGRWVVAVAACAGVGLVSALVIRPRLSVALGLMLLFGLILWRPFWFWQEGCESPLVDKLLSSYRPVAKRKYMEVVDGAARDGVLHFSTLNDWLAVERSALRIGAGLDGHGMRRGAWRRYGWRDGLLARRAALHRSEPAIDCSDLEDRRRSLDQLVDRCLPPIERYRGAVGGGVAIGILLLACAVGIGDDATPAAMLRMVGAVWTIGVVAIVVKFCYAGALLGPCSEPEYADHFLAKWRVSDATAFAHLAVDVIELDAMPCYHLAWWVQLERAALDRRQCEIAADGSGSVRRAG